MARGVNKTIILGTLGRDPEAFTTSSGKSVTTISVATSESWKDRNTGQQQERTEWHRIVVWGPLAEIAAQYLKKGAQVYIEGRLQTRKWQGNDGQDRYTTEIIANEMQMIGSRSESDAQSSQHQQRDRPPAQQQPRQPDDGFDDIPF